MASMPVSIPLDLKIKGFKNLAQQIQQQNELLGLLTMEVEKLVTNVERLNTSLDAIQEDIRGLKEAATTKSDADAATIAQLRSDLEAAISQGQLDTGTIESLRAALATAENSLNTAQNDFDAALQPLADKAEGIDAETPPVDQEPPVSEEPPVDQEPVPEEPQP